MAFTILATLVSQFFKPFIHSHEFLSKNSSGYPEAKLNLLTLSSETQEG